MELSTLKKRIMTKELKCVIQMKIKKIYHTGSHFLWFPQPFSLPLFYFFAIFLIFIVQHKASKTQLTRLIGNKNWQVKDLQDQPVVQKKKAEDCLLLPLCLLSEIVNRPQQHRRDQEQHTSYIC